MKTHKLIELGKFYFQRQDRFIKLIIKSVSCKCKPNFVIDCYRCTSV